MNAIKLLRYQLGTYGDTVRSLGPWLIVAVPVWIIVGRKAYAQERERQRRLMLAPVLKNARQLGKRP